MIGFGFDLQQIQKNVQEQQAQDAYTHAMEHPAPAAPASHDPAAPGKQPNPSDVNQAVGNYADESNLTEEQKAQRKDREQAARDLSSKFDILPAGYKGPRKPNQLTAEEYAKVVNTYSDIRTNHSDIKLEDGILPPWVQTDENKAKYEAAVKAKQDMMMGDIGKLMETSAGRELVFKLSNNVTKDGRHATTELHGENAFADRGGWATDSQNNGAAPYNGFGTGASAEYQGGQRGSDVQLFQAFTQALHVTTGTEQRGRLGDDYGTQTGPDGHRMAKIDEHLPRSLDGADRERAAMIGLGGYGSKLNGKSITENAYAREQAQLNPNDKDLYQQKKTVD